MFIVSEVRLGLGLGGWYLLLEVGTLATCMSLLCVDSMRGRVWYLIRDRVGRVGYGM